MRRSGPLLLLLLFTFTPACRGPEAFGCRASMVQASGASVPVEALTGMSRFSRPDLEGGPKEAFVSRTDKGLRYEMAARDTGDFRFHLYNLLTLEQQVIEGAWTPGEPVRLEFDVDSGRIRFDCMGGPPWPKSLVPPSS